MMRSSGGLPGRVAKGAEMPDQAAAGAVGEFESALRAQIAEALGRLAQARAAEDYESIGSLAQRLRYLLEVAADSGIAVDGGEGDVAAEEASGDTDGRDTGGGGTGGGDTGGGGTGDSDTDGRYTDEATGEVRA